MGLKFLEAMSVLSQGGAVRYRNWPQGEYLRGTTAGKIEHIINGISHGQDAWFPTNMVNASIWDVHLDTTPIFRPKKEDLIRALEKCPQDTPVRLQIGSYNGCISELKIENDAVIIVGEREDD